MREDYKNIDWAGLKRLQGRYHQPQAGGLSDYWQSDRLLADYDHTFAQRIGWKWQAVLKNLVARDWQPKPHQVLIDWGCGSGVASEKFLEIFGSNHTLYLYDRSERAMTFALNKLRARFPNAKLHKGLPEPALQSSALIFISHVLTEMTERDVQALSAMITKMDAVVWVEPGTPFCSQRLIEVREQLRSRFSIVAPCPHGDVCGMKTADNAHNWCHFFAPTPSEVFQSAFWRRFADELQIDLHSLPVSYLVLTRTPYDHGSEELVVGYPRLYKGYAKALLCSKDGVSEKMLQKRDDPALYKSFDKKQLHWILRSHPEATE